MCFVTNVICYCFDRKSLQFVLSLDNKEFCGNSDKYYILFFQYPKFASRLFGLYSLSKEFREIFQIFQVRTSLCPFKKISEESNSCMNSVVYVWDKLKSSLSFRGNLSADWIHSHALNRKIWGNRNDFLMLCITCCQLFKVDSDSQKCLNYGITFAMLSI